MLFEVGNVRPEDIFCKVGTWVGVLLFVVNITSLMEEFCGIVSACEILTSLLEPAVSLLGGDGGPFRFDFPPLDALSLEILVLEGFRLVFAAPVLPLPLVAPEPSFRLLVSERGRPRNA